MKITRGEIISGFITVASFIAGLYFFQYLPDMVASHWDAAGEINGYMPKFWGAFFVPIICVIFWILMVVFPRIDPKKDNIEQFRNAFDNFIIIIFLFFNYLFGLTLWANLGGVFNMSQALAPALGVIFFFVGVLVSKTKMNYSIGIRTPWTLSNEIVWEKTHRLGAVLFKISGVLCFSGLFWPALSIFIVIGSVILAALVSVIYSYIEYRRQMKK